MRIINSTVHGLLDYLAAITLIIAPFVLGIAEQSVVIHWLSVLAGAGLIGYSLITTYTYSIAKVIPLKLHLIFDLAAAVVFILVPFVLSITGTAAIYSWVMGVGVLMVVLLTNSSKEM